MFVSYSRTNIGFVRDLVGALRDAGRRVWVDLEGLYAGEQWWNRICAEIEAADTILLVLSPSSAESPACAAEIEHAARLRKRIIPLLYEHLGNRGLPEVVSSTQWLLAFQQGGSFCEGMEALQKALDADPEWLRGHTRWLQRALDWDRRGRPRDLLLTGSHLVEAEYWLDDAPRHRDLAVAPLHYSYIRAARQQQLFSRAREHLSTHGQEVEALETAVAACELATDVPKPHPADFSTLCECLKRVRRAFPLRGHGGPVWNIGLDAKGDRAVTQGTNGRAQLWDLTQFPPRLVARLEDAGRSRDEAAVLSPDGSRLLTCKYEAATLWDSMTGRLVAELRAGCPAKSVKFSPDGKKVIGAAADNTWIWNSDTGTLETTLDCPSCREAFITTDGSKALARGYPAVRIWNLLTGEMCCELTTGIRWAFSAARFSPDGTRVLTANETRSIRVWSASKGENLGLLRGESEIKDAWFSPDGKMIVARGAGSLRLWRVADSVALPTPWWPNWIALFALSPDGEHLLTTNGDAAGKVEVWEIATGRGVSVLGHGATVTAIEWSDDGRLVLTAGEDGLIRVWKTNTWSTEALIDPSAGEVHAAVLVPRGHGILAGYADGAARLWRFDDSLAIAMTEGEVLPLVMARRAGTAAVLPKENEPPWLCDTTALQRLGTLQTGSHCRACFSPDGRWIAVLGSGMLHVIQVDSLETIFRWPAKVQCWKLCFSSGGDRLLALGRPSIVWKVSAGGSPLILDSDARQISSAEFSPDGSQLCVGESEYRQKAGRLELFRHRARILDAGTGEECVALGEYRNEINKIRFSPTGDRILLIDSWVGVILDATTGQVQRYLGERGEGLVYSAEFYPDGTRVVTTGKNGELRVWNLTTGECERSTRLKGSADVVLSPDGSYFATEGVAQLWDAETCQPLVTYSDGLETYPFHATFDALGDHLVMIYGRGSGRAVVYPASFREFLRLAKGMVPAARKSAGMNDRIEPAG